MTHPEPPSRSDLIATMPSRSPSWPIVAQIPIRLDAQERRHVSQIATKLLTDEPALHFTTEAFGPRVSAGIGSGPSLLLQDLEGVALASAPTDSSLRGSAHTWAF